MVRNVVACWRRREGYCARRAKHCRAIVDGTVTPSTDCGTVCAMRCQEHCGKSLNSSVGSNPPTTMHYSPTYSTTPADISVFIAAQVKSPGKAVVPPPLPPHAQPTPAIVTRTPSRSEPLAAVVTEMKPSPIKMTNFLKRGSGPSGVGVKPEAIAADSQSTKPSAPDTSAWPDEYERRALGASAKFDPIADDLMCVTCSKPLKIRTESAVWCSFCAASKPQKSWRCCAGCGVSLCLECVKVLRRDSRYDREAYWKCLTCKTIVRTETVQTHRLTCAAPTVRKRGQLAEESSEPTSVTKIPTSPVLVERPTPVKQEARSASVELDHSSGKADSRHLAKRTSSSVRQPERSANSTRTARVETVAGPAQAAAALVSAPPHLLDDDKDDDVVDSRNPRSTSSDETAKLEDSPPMTTSTLTRFSARLATGAEIDATDIPVGWFASTVASPPHGTNASRRVPSHTEDIIHASAMRAAKLLPTTAAEVIGKRPVGRHGNTENEKLFEAAKRRGNTVIVQGLPRGTTAQDIADFFSADVGAVQLSSADPSDRKLTASVAFPARTQAYVALDRSRDALFNGAQIFCEMAGGDTA